MELTKTTVDLPRHDYRELRRILLGRDKTFAAWIREKVREEIKGEAKTARR